ncbi:hypothetical protein, partial [Streptacidiphilus jiangxiensis]
SAHGKADQPAASATAKASGRHDPLTQGVEFGWLPAGIQQGTIQDTEWDGQAFTAAGSASTPGVMASVQLKGHDFVVDTPSPIHPAMHAVPGPLVHGRPSHWMVDQGGRSYHGGEYILRWYLPDGRGAQVLLAGAKLGEATARATALRVAENLRFPAAPEGTPLPYYVTGLPAGEHLVSVSFVQHTAGLGRPWQVSAAYTTRNAADWQSTAGGEIDWQIAPHVAGKPLMGGDRCVTRDGLDLCVEGGGPALEAVGGLDGLLNKITVLGTDPAHWTTEVNR